MQQIWRVLTRLFFSSPSKRKRSRSDADEEEDNSTTTTTSNTSSPSSRNTRRRVVAAKMQSAPQRSAANWRVGLESPTATQEWQQRQLYINHQSTTPTAFRSVKAAAASQHIKHPPQQTPTFGHQQRQTSVFRFDGGAAAAIRKNAPPPPSYTHVGGELVATDERGVPYMHQTSNINHQNNHHNHEQQSSSVSQSEDSVVAFSPVSNSRQHRDTLLWGGVPVSPIGHRGCGGGGEDDDQQDCETQEHILRRMRETERQFSVTEESFKRQMLSLSLKFTYTSVHHTVQSRLLEEQLARVVRDKNDTMLTLERKLEMVQLHEGKRPTTRQVQTFLPGSMDLETLEAKKKKSPPPPAKKKGRGLSPVDLTSDDASVTAVFQRKDTSTVLSNLYNIQLTVALFACLKPGKWLNSEVIGFFMNLVEVWFPNDDTHPKAYFHNSFFYHKLSTDGFASVARWTRRVDLFAFDHIYVPINAGGAHWYLARINLKDKCTEVYDSLGSGGGSAVHDNLVSYMESEHLAKKKTKLDTSKWTRRVVDVPKQENGHDCGVFMCMYAYHLVAGLDLDFSQENMSHLRVWIGSEVLKHIAAQSKK